MKGWIGEVGVACRGVHVAWAARLVDPKGETVWSGSDRLPVGRSADEALVDGVDALQSASRRHRKLPEAIRTNLHGARVPGVVVARVPVVMAQALAMLPATTGFSADRLVRVGQHRAVAHGESGDYEIDLVAQSCSCPQFRFRRVLCKHLRAALGLGNSRDYAGGVTL